MKKVLSLLLTVALLGSTLMLSGCGTQENKSSGKQKVVLNEVAHSIFYAPMYAAIENGYFAEEGIDLDLVTGFGVILLVQNRITI